MCETPSFVKLGFAELRSQSVELLNLMIHLMVIWAHQIFGFYTL